MAGSPGKLLPPNGFGMGAETPPLPWVTTQGRTDPIRSTFPENADKRASTSQGLTCTARKSRSLVQASREACGQQHLSTVQRLHLLFFLHLHPCHSRLGVRTTHLRVYTGHQTPRSWWRKAAGVLSQVLNTRSRDFFLSSKAPQRRAPGMCEQVKGFSRMQPEQDVPRPPPVSPAQSPRQLPS